MKHAIGLLTSKPLPMSCRNPLRWTEVRKLNEKDYRKWMVRIAAGTLAVAAIRLLIGG